MKEYGKTRVTMAMIGCALILATGIGSTSIINALMPDIIIGLEATLTSIMIGPATATLTAFIASVFAARVIDLMTPKWSLAFGTVCVSGALLMIGLAPSIPMWIAANFLNGIALAFGAYAAIAGVIAEFRYDKAQSTIGIVSAIGALLISGEVLLAGQLLKAMTYHEVFYICAGIALVVGLLSNFILIGKTSTRKEIQAAKALQTTAQKNKGNSEEDKAPLGITLKAALKSPVLYLFVFAMFFGSWAYNGITSYLPIFLTTYGISTSEAATYAAILTSIIALIKFGAGWFIKKFGARALAVSIFVIFAAGVSILLYWTQTGQTYLIYIALVAISFIGFVSILPGLFIPEIFGMRDYTSLNAVGMAGFYCGATTLLIGLSVIVSSFGIFNAYIALIALGIISMGCLLAAMRLSPLRSKNHKNASEATTK